MVNTVDILNSIQSNTIIVHQYEGEKTLKIGFEGTVFILDPINKKRLFTRTIYSEQEGNIFFDKYKESIKPSHFTKFSLFLAPYNNALSFFKYLALPTFFLMAKWELPALSIYAIGMHILFNLLNATYVLFDLVTLPLRLLVTPFKLFYDIVISPQQPLPIEKLLSEETLVKKESLQGVLVLGLSLKDNQINDTECGEIFRGKVAKVKTSKQWTTIFTNNLPRKNDPKALSIAIDLYQMGSKDKNAGSWKFDRPCYAERYLSSIGHLEFGEL